MKFKRFLSALLAVVMILSVMPLANAVSISDGSATCTVSKTDRHHYLKTTAGTTLGASAYEYTTNDGIKGPAYCINWGLALTSKSLKITGRYTASPKTMGAFANGYPQRPLADFLQINASEPKLAGLTEAEYAYATQVAVWATLGQLGVEGTNFTAGRVTIKAPSNDAQQIRVYTALTIILHNANGWDKPLYTGMYIRTEDDRPGNSVELDGGTTLAEAADNNEQGIMRETINGKEYYTRQFIAASATSTWPNEDQYCLYLWSTGSPMGTIMTDMDNKPLALKSLSGGGTAYVLPTEYRETSLNANGSEYSGAFKICIPVDAAEDTGEVNILASGKITQYDIYLAYNPTASEQSYIIGDPGYNDLSASGKLKWGGEHFETGRIRLVKVDGVGNPLSGAKFTLSGSDGSEAVGTSDANGVITWNDLNVHASYVITETQAPEGFGLVDPIHITIKANQTAFVTVQDSTEKQLTIKKTDKQNGYSLQGAVFAFEQVDGDFYTEATTGHDGTIQLPASSLPVGSYRVSELSAPAGYERDTTVKTVEWDGTKDITLHFEDVRKPTLIIYKTNATGDLALTGAVFEVYKDGKLVTTVTTDDAGLAYVPGISEGYYEVLEITAPPGYQLDSTRHGIHVDPYDPATDDDPMLTVVNRAKPSLQIIKYDAQTMKRLPGVTFEVYRDAQLIGSYVTDGDGEIYLPDLTPGTYLVKEVAAGGTHVVNSTPQQIELKADDGLCTLVFQNYVKPGMHLIKLDSQTLEPMEGVRFEIALVGGSFKQEFITDKNGEIDLSKLTPGAYTVKELSTKDGWLIDDGQRIIQLNEGENATFVFTNTRKPALEIVKYDPQHDKYLAGATFRVARIEDGAHYLDKVTDVDGRIKISDLEPGVYSVQELAAPEGYCLNDTEYHVELFDGKTSQLVVTNEEKPHLQIIKTDANTGEPIAGVTFTVRKVDSSTLTTVTTVEDGTAFLEHLDPGVYEVIEQSVPAAYLLDPTPQQITLTPGKTGIVQFQNYPRPALEILKTDKQGNAVPGVVFSVAQKDGTLVGDFTTDTQGRISIPELAEGYYLITEKSVPEGFILNTQPREVLMVEGKTTAVTIENDRKPNLTVSKVDAVTGDPVKGAKFQIWYGVNGSLDGDLRDLGFFYSDAQGQIVLENQDVGWYRIKEVEPSSGYAIKGSDTQDVFLKANEDQTVTFENTPLSAIVIRKVDSDTGKPLEGAWFRLRFLGGASGTGGTVIGEYQTSVNGSIVVTGLKAGTYIIEEIASAEGHVIGPDATRTVYLSGEDQDVVTVTFCNAPVGSLLIKKIDSVTHAPLSDVEFFVTLSDGAVVGNGNGKFVTDSEGTILISGLEPGVTVVAKETRAKDGYLLDDTPQTVKIKSGETVTLEFRNAPEGGLIIKKLDAVTREPISGVVFKVTTSDGKVVGDANGEYTTGSAGTVRISGLPPATYVVQELRAKPGYLLDDAAKTIEVKDNGTYTLEFLNQPTGGLVIIKKDSVTGKPLEGVTFKITTSTGEYVADKNGQISSNGLYYTDKNGQIVLTGLVGAFVVTEEKTIPGYTIDEHTRTQTVAVEANDTQTLIFYNTPVGGMQLIKTDARSGDRVGGCTFEIRRLNDALIGTYTTDRNGVFSVPLEAGSYYAVEVKANSRYLLDDTPYYFEVKDGETAVVRVTNQKASSILIHKIDADTGEGIYGAVFLIYDADRNPIDQVTTDQDGYAYLDRELTAGKYFIKELENDGYEVDGETKTVYVKSGQTTEITWENSSEKGQIQVYKYSEDYNSVTGAAPGSELKGAVFEIIKAHSGAVVGYITTDARGVAASPKLPLGRYFVREVTAPAYYQLSGERMEAEIEYPGQIIKLTAFNQSADLAVAIKKTGNQQVIAGDAMRYDFSGITNSSNVPLENFYWSDRVPTDAARANTIVTGTYSQRLTYRIIYKTNSGDWRVLRENLLTTNNYSFSLTAAALGLMQGEYVTDVRLEFGTVAAGFTSVTKPMLTVNTLPTLPGGYQIVNRCEVGGQYQGTWQQATASWLTTTVKFGSPTLPKTGY